jgi:hypothetical protein
MKAIDTELHSRGLDARLSLGALLDNEDRFVRYYAAIRLLGLLPNKARSVMEWNAKYSADSIAADARGFLGGLDDGSYRPD